LSVKKDKVNFNPVPKYDKEKSFYSKAIVDQKTGDTWTYNPSIEEIRYRNWLAEICDPITGEPHKGKKTEYDVAEDGTETERIVQMEPRYIVKAIQRERTVDKREFLLTKGRWIAYNEFGEEKGLPCAFMEKYNEVVWDFRRSVNQSGRLVQECLGPKPGADVTHYTVPYTPANVDKLYAQAEEPVSLLVKDQRSLEAKEAINLDMFRNKPFDYIINMDYLSEKDKAEKLAEFKAMQGIQEVPSKRK
jgi:hypothetical protein